MSFHNNVVLKNENYGRVVLIVLVMLLAAWPAMRLNASPAGVIRYVAADGVDSGGCTNTAAVCQSLQYAVNQASSGDDIFVAGGTYIYKVSADQCSFLTTRAVLCMVNKNLRIVGGFSRSNWAVPLPVQNTTIIDGQNNYRGVSVVSYNGVSRLQMEFITLQNGRAKGAATGGDFFTYAPGGGIDATSSSVALFNVIFKNNVAIGGDAPSGYGGGGIGGGLVIRASPVGAVSTLENVTFDGNIAQGGTGPARGGVAQGGAMYIDTSTLVGSNVVFTNNQALGGNSTGSGTSKGLQSDALGGAVAFGGNSNGTLNTVTFRTNVCKGGNAATDGGNCFGGALYAENNAVVSVNKALIEQNAARGGVAVNPGGAFGGGVSTFDSNATITQSRIVNNDAQGGTSSNNSLKGSAGGGGAAFIGWSGPHQVNLTNNVIADNQIRLAGDGIDPGMGGAGLSFQGVNASITHSTIANNTFNSSGFALGQAIYVLSAAGRNSAVTMNYSLVANHTNGTNAAAIHVSQGNAITFNRGLFANNTRNTNQDNVPFPAGTFTGVGTVISAPSAGFRATTNYRLGDSSPAIDQAIGSTTTTDLDDILRPRGAAADLGAYEHILYTDFVYLPLTIR